MPYQALLNLPVSPGQHDFSASASEIITDHLSVPQASLQWAEDCSIHHADEAFLKRYKWSLRQSIAHFERVQNEQAASGKMSFTGNQPPGNVGDSAFMHSKVSGPTSCAAAGGVCSMNISDTDGDAVDLGLVHPLRNAAGSTAGDSNSTLVNNLISPEGKSSDEDDGKTIVRVFQGRNSLRQTRPRPLSNLWRDMMRHARSSSGTVSGAVSSTTARGVLQRYGGRALESLAPTPASSGPLR